MLWLWNLAQSDKVTVEKGYVKATTKMLIKVMPVEGIKTCHQIEVKVDLQRQELQTSTLALFGLINTA